MTIDQRPVLVLGATGYVGTRLVPRLLNDGMRVRALARTPEKLHGCDWGAHERLEIVRGDVFDRETLVHATQGCRAAYYLVHSMNPGNQDFAGADRRAAENFVEAAQRAGLKQIIYLSGLGESGDHLSEHLRSRTEVGEVLRSGTVPVTILRAAMIIGSGSASFEILRYLVERLPVMVTPRWVDTPCQPIGIRNVLNYLKGCLDCPQVVGETFDIGQDDIVTYRQLMKTYAEVAGLPRRLIVPVPVLTPKLSSYWIHLVTPMPAALAQPLAAGLSNKVICREQRIRDILPQRIINTREAIELALVRQKNAEVESTWYSAGLIPPAELSGPDDPDWAGGTVYRDQRRITIDLPPKRIWDTLSALGGERGWYYGDWLWSLRGILDKLVGGVGLRRGRRHPHEIRIGDALDFWRVADIKEGERLLLVAEMKLPGYATLEFLLMDDSAGTVLTQTARFRPKGLWGILYWWAVSPLHHFVFNGLLRGIEAAAKQEGQVP